MRTLSLSLIALLAVGAYCQHVPGDANLGSPYSRTNTGLGSNLGFGSHTGLGTHTGLGSTVAGMGSHLTGIHGIHKRAEMETKMNTEGGPGMETNTQMDTGDQRMSAQAETHDRFRRWGGYYGGMGYGGMGYGGYGRGYGMGYGMRGYGGYGGMGGFYG